MEPKMALERNQKLLWNCTENGSRMALKWHQNSAKTALEWL